MGLEKDKEKRLASTGKWFEPGVKTKINIWSAIVLPIILIISLLFTVAVYFAGTFHLGKLKATWMSTFWHIVHISGLCIITGIGLFDWLFLEGNTIPRLSIFARSIQEILISPLMYLAMGLLNQMLNNNKA